MTTSTSVSAPSRARSSTARRRLAAVDRARLTQREERPAAHRARSDRVPPHAPSAGRWDRPKPAAWASGSASGCWRSGHTSSSSSSCRPCESSARSGWRSRVGSCWRGSRPGGRAPGPSTSGRSWPATVHSGSLPSSSGCGPSAGARSVPGWGCCSWRPSGCAAAAGSGGRPGSARSSSSGAGGARSAA